MTKLRKPSKNQLEASSGPAAGSISGAPVAQTFAEESNLQYIANLEMKNVQLAQEVQKLTLALQESNVLLAHCEQLMRSANPGDNGVIMVLPSDEEIIIDLDIKRLKEVAMGRKLTLDEVKQLDLLVKNKKLAKLSNEAVDIEGKRLPANTDEKTLMLIASVPLKLEGGK